MNKTIQLINSINLLLIKNQLLKPNRSYLITISGGQDSIFIILLFYILKKQWNIEFHLLSCNHLWRKEACYVFFHLSKVSFSFKLNFYYILKINKTISEEIARNWRLKSYFRTILFSNCITIITGHTESDFIETFLLNIFRGSGLGGISSLKIKKHFKIFKKNDFRISNKQFSKFKKLKKKQNLQSFFIQNKFFQKQKPGKGYEKISTTNRKNFHLLEKKLFFLLKIKTTGFSINRPLLTKSRFSIQQICTNWKLPLFPDITNKENFYHRNRLRQQLLPILRFFFNPKIDFILLRYSKVAETEEQLLEYLISQVFQEIFFENNNSYSINFSLFCSLPLAIQRKLSFFFITKKLLLKSNYFTINLFVSILQNEFSKTNKISSTKSKKNLCNWIFFPTIGLIFRYKTIIIFYK